MKIRNRTMSGQVHGVWVKPGDVLEVDDENGARYVKLGYAEEIAAKPAKEERAVVSEPEETAVLKRSPGRPRKSE